MSHPRGGIRLAAVVAAICCLLLAGPSAAPAQGEPRPGSAEWLARDVENLLWMTGRTQDQLTHPEYVLQLVLKGNPLFLENLADQLNHPTRPIVSLSQLVPGARAADVYRHDWERQGRGIMVPIEYENRYGARIQGEVWAPRQPFTDPVTGEADPGPYPGIVITTGSVQGFKELYWWAAQGLAEAGYVVMTYDVQGQGKSEVFGHDPQTGFIRCAPADCPGFPFQQAANFIEGTEDALDWFLSDRNPLRGLGNADRIGLAGHSLGAAAVTRVGNADERVDAVVAWDNANLPPDVPPRVPTMGQNAEAGFFPEPHLSPPNPDSATNAFWRFKDAGVPAMQVALRGSTHLEWTYIPFLFAASRDGERVAMHYTLAWFDRWLKPDTHAADARERLTAEVFDDSADASAIGTGRWQPGVGNVPYRIAGIPVAERLSFYLRSAYAFDGLECRDMRAGC